MSDSMSRTEHESGADMQIQEWLDRYVDLQRQLKEAQRTITIVREKLDRAEQNAAMDCGHARKFLLKQAIPVKCPGCGGLIFIRENLSIVAHYESNGMKCRLNETTADSSLLQAKDTSRCSECARIETLERQHEADQKSLRTFDELGVQNLAASMKREKRIAELEQKVKELSR